MSEDLFAQWYKLSQLRIDPSWEASTLLSDIQTKEVLTPHFTIYWEHKEDHPRSFDFLVTEWCAGDGDDVYVQIALQGWAAFDGIRHAWFYRNPKDPDMHGYANYLNTSAFIKIFQKLEQLKIQYDVEG